MIPSSTFSLATANGLFLFQTNEIVRLEASSNYTNIYFTNSTKLTSAKVLKEFDKMLVPCGFIRIHRKHLVNRQHISCVNREGVIMKDAFVAAISRRLKRGILQLLRTAA
ncbi:MAG: LytTR family transcriptional regulator [Sphingobacteriales bacterium]|nr:MAG: LytTR family transcriptional regulator [Sphingobacteriales bacterium]